MTPSPVTAQRDSSLDFLKLLLVFLVVAGHIIERYSLGPEQIIYRWIYLFHMPAFIFLSGMLSSVQLDAKSGRRLIATILLPLIAHQALLKGLDATLFDRAYELKPSLPYWALWYLMSLLTWRLLLPLVCGSGYPLVVAILVSLLAGFFKDFGYGWSVSRTFVFLPFFVAGHLYATRHGRTLPAFAAGRAVVAAALLMALLATAWLTRDVAVKWLYGSFSYARFADSQWEGVALRSLQLAAGAAGTLAVLKLAMSPPRLAALGRYTMAIYISHIYLVKIAQANKWFALLPQHGFPTRFAMVIVCSLACVAIGIALGRLLPFIFDFSWLFRRRGQLTPANA